MAVKDPAKRDLYKASDAFFAVPVDLAGELDANPTEILDRLRNGPERIAPVRPSLGEAHYRRAYLRLLTAALAYVKTEKV